jgi:hypothetical protein
MTISRRSKLAAGVAALATVLGGGAAVAATGALSPAEESEAIANDVAEQLGVEPSELTAAVKQALTNRVDAAVEAGTITEEQAAELKERIEAGEPPLFGFPHGGRHHHGVFADLGAAASYLDVTEAELRTALEDGDTLADVAEAEGKSVDGLVQALTDAATERLDAAVEAGRLTEAQKQEMLEDLEDRITDLVNGTFTPAPGRGFGRGLWGADDGANA